ncbi:tRNA (adenosine(37)-N6)-dimethylallyltransferase MiaA [bacterium]|nr:tRNA (adenosine(37)-N6)-dimethylallyltransferase MiaA [bacterium]
MSQKPILIVIGGPTAVGKTALAVEIASELKTEIISSDSRQIYKELDIGVAKPSVEELAKVQHHFISTHSIFNDFNAGAYEAEALDVLDEVFSSHNTAVLSGGSGLYIKAVLDGFDPLPGKNEKLRNELKLLYEQEGIEGLISYLAQLNPNTKLKDHQNPQRLIRAIEIEKQVDVIPKVNKRKREFSPYCFYLNMDREILYSRINERVDKMVSAGLVDEAREFYKFKDLNALQTVGYKELFMHFSGELSLDAAIEKIKKNSRNYAKRQLTWFRNDPRFIEVSGLEEMKKFLPKSLSNNLV